MVSRALKILTLTCIVSIWRVAPARADWQFAPFFGYAFNGETTLVTPEALGDDQGSLERRR